MVRNQTWEDESMTETKAKVNGRPERIFSPLVLALLLVFATLVLFWPAQRFEYMNLDDYPYVLENGMVTGGLSWGAVKQAFTTVHEQWWLPLLWISYMADVQLFGAGPHGHHLVNILLHAANAGLLFWVLCRLTGSRWPSAFVAALFAWHPTRVEAVAWIAARKDVLSGLFFMLALLAYVWHAERPSATRMRWVLLLLLMGLMSKATLVALPFILLLLDWWPLGRAKRMWGAGAWNEWKPLVQGKIPLFGLAAVFMGLNLWTHVSGHGPGDASLLDRMGLVAPNVFAYLGKITVPIHLNILYPENDVVSWPYAILATGVLLGATWVIFQQRENRPHVLVGWLWFLLALAPVIRGVRLGLAQYADRWTYLPLIGLGLALAWTGTEWSAGRRKRWIPVAGGLILAACLVRTHAQLPWWQNSLTMFQRAAYLAPGAPVVQTSLGQALCETGKIKEGVAHLQEAVRLQPANPEYLTNLGVALLRVGRAEEALSAHEEAIRLDPGASRFHNNRGTALLTLGRKDEARSAFEEAVRLQPDNATAHYNLGGLLSPADALSHYQIAVQRRPDVALNWYNLGITYAQLGRISEAAPCVEQALQIDPNLPDARASLARMRMMLF
jgi:protein O-mannosyl-transferase